METRDNAISLTLSKQTGLKCAVTSYIPLGCQEERLHSSCQLQTVPFWFPLWLHSDLEEPRSPHAAIQKPGETWEFFLGSGTC